MEQYARTRILLGSAAMEKLRSAKVMVFGLGGVGSYVVETLARSGVGKLELVDHDTVSLTNCNRQLYALRSTIGMDKVEAARLRVLDIDPQIQVIPRKAFFGPDTLEEFDLTGCHYIVDAIDTVTAKLALAEAAQKAGVPILSCLGTGNKLDPGKFQIADISKTSVCPLARVMRKECAKRGIRKLKVLYSTEDALTPEETDEPLPEGRRSIPGSVAWVPSVAGLMIAGEVIQDLTK